MACVLCKTDVDFSQAHWTKTCLRDTVCFRQLLGHVEISNKCLSLNLSLNMSEVIIESGIEVRRGSQV